ncbi:hypothetical protein GE09DRAFT_624646 [Coniochaeta sp. 2T2.1]|nr:hypothetical protein GE09DRAFT_624646 [Coniochaeta sp. 2T2.1]
MLPQSTILMALLAAAVSTASPTSLNPARSIVRRWENGVDCTDSIVNSYTPGLLFINDPDGISVACSDAGIASSAGGYYCYRTWDNHNGLGDIVKCPADPAPSKNPDGSDAAGVDDGLIQTWCNNVAGGLSVTFANTIGCLLYGYYEANGNPLAQEESGAMAVCDTIFSGLCTYFKDVAPEVAAGMDKACIDDPNSNACAFANPGKA